MLENKESLSETEQASTNIAWIIFIIFIIIMLYGVFIVIKKYRKKLTIGKFDNNQFIYN